MRFAHVLFWISVGIPAAALAQDTDQRQMAANSAESWGLPDDPEYLAAMQEFGECSVHDRGSDALRYLPGSKRSQDSLFWMLLISNSCDVNGRTPNAAPVFYRGVVAEYYLEHDFSLPDLQPKRSVQKIFAEPDADDFGKLEEADRMALTLIEAGTCVARTDRAAISTLFETATGTQGEADAIGALVPALTSCLPRNTRLNVHPFQLRGYLAEGAYRFGVMQEEGA